MRHVYDMIIIGGGPAGYAAALYAGRAGLDAILIERMSAGGQMALTGDIDNYPGFAEGIDGFTLGMNMQQGAQRFGIKTVYADVKAVELGEKIKKITTSSEDLFSKTVVIATGANPRELALQGEREMVGKGVHYCAHCDGRFYKDKTVIVVGGGDSAAVDALYLSKLAKKVYIVHRRDTLRAEKVYHKPLMAAENVEFVWDSSIVDFIVGEKLVGAKLKNLKTGAFTDVMCDGIFVSIGRTPATGFVQDKLLLDKDGYIVADESTKTNICGVYAAGDVRTKALRQVVTAVSDGAVAVHFAGEYLAENKA